MNKVYFEDWQVGERVVTAGRTINETDLEVFTALTGDWSRLHTDQEYAQSTRFGGRIIHGLLSLSIGVGLWVQATNSTWLLWAIEKARFVASVRVGDTLHIESELVKLTEIDNERGLITVSSHMKNQRGENVLISTSKFLISRRPPPEGSRDE
jgi:3-hydroxybutyryl-CoA dehydratase